MAVAQMLSHRSSAGRLGGSNGTDALFNQDRVMANFKRGRPKAARAGCKMCKPNKLGKGLEKTLGHRGFGKLRDERHADEDLKNRS